MKRLVCFSFLLFFFVSCSNHSHQLLSKDNELLPSDSSNVVVWPQAEGFQIGEYYQEFDTIKYVFLETSALSMLDQIRGVSLFEDRMLVVSNTLKMFDLQGKYLYDIGQKGNAANEYGSVGDVFVSEEKEIFFSDKLRNRIMKYSYDGTFQEPFGAIPSVPSRFCVISDSIVFGTYAGYSNEVPYFQMKCMNKEGKVLYEAFPNETGKSHVSAQLIRHDASTSYLCCPFSDYIYLIGAETIKPVVSMGFYEEESINAFLKRSKGMDAHEFNSLVFSQNEVVSSVDLIKCKSRWLAMYQLGKKSVLSFIGSERRDYLRSDFERREVHYPEHFVSSSEDWLLGYIEPVAFDYLSDEKTASTLVRIKDSTGKMLEVENLLEQNPIIVMYHLKSN